jgi:hypothetical protein
MQAAKIAGASLDEQQTTAMARVAGNKQSAKRKLNEAGISDEKATNSYLQDCHTATNGSTGSRVS